jgi:hypothetical protein
MTKDNVMAVLASYGRTALVAVLSVYLAMGGEIDLQAFLYAAVAAIAGPAMRAVNPHDPEFGRLEAPDHIEEH